MLEAAWWGFVAGAALLIGALLGIYVRASTRVVGLVMGFGVGVLISAVAFELTMEAYEHSGTAPVVLGLLAGALTFFAGDWWLDQRGAEGRKNMEGMAAGAGPAALVLGALLDGIPESAAIGISLVDGGGVGVAVVAAVFLSNIPEGLSASAGMKASGSSTRHVLGLWATVAAGAVLTMLADTMVPEAVKYAGSYVGLVTVLGFGGAFLMSAMA